MNRADKFILWFDEIRIEDVPLVGGKNASLGEMYHSLSRTGVRVPNGFAITATAYKYFIQHAGIDAAIKKLVRGLNTKNVRQLAERGKKIREIIRHHEFPKDLHDHIVNAYNNLASFYHAHNIDVAVRSSATAEDLPNASFAGQQETFLNICGEEQLLEACRDCFASLFTNRAIAYRQEKGFDHFKVYLSIGVQKMVRSDHAVSGVMFTLDTETGFKDAILINASWGLGENIVKGVVNPDQFYVFKPTLKQGHYPIISKNLGDKAIKMIYAETALNPTKNVDVEKKDRERFCLPDKEIIQLATWACIIEDYYSKKNKQWTPMDIEWAKDGILNQLFIVQARPETVQSQKNKNVIEEYILLKKTKVLCQGKRVGNKIGHGTATVIKDVKDIAQFKSGCVLVTEMTDPDWVPIMRMASAIVTNSGGRTCHAAIVSRELGIPCIVGTINATETIIPGQKITVSCAEGEDGKVYDGLLPFTIKKTDIKNLQRPKTKIMINIGNPEQAFDLSFVPNDGVGLAREEFIINSYIKVHPLALIHFNKLPRTVQNEIQSLTKGYAQKTDFFIDKLAQGVATIAAAFYPKDVIVRMSDFKSNEYANLIGGKQFEPQESNPMIGWRGASRYYKPGYKEGFAMECKAMKKVRDTMGLTNVKLMIPMCRTIEESKKVLAVMKENGLKQGKNRLEIYAMCELPSNVVLAEEFLEIFDGFSIGSNDLTQMILGVDRDSELVADVYDERNPAVTRMIATVINIAKKKGKKIGICGDAPSTFPEFAEFLVQCGIDSISLSPDAVVKTTIVIAKAERNKKS